MTFRRVLFTIAIVLISSEPSSSLNCYQCISSNAQNSNCITNPDYRQNFECKIRIGSRRGLFDGRYCVTVAGTSGKKFRTFRTLERKVLIEFLTKDQTRGLVFARTCLYELPQNLCGRNEFSNFTLTGCIKSCSTNGCNSAPGSLTTPFRGEGSSANCNSQNQLIFLVVVLITIFFTDFNN